MLISQNPHDRLASSGLAQQESLFHMDSKHFFLCSVKRNDLSRFCIKGTASSIDHTLCKKPSSKNIEYCFNQSEGNCMIIASEAIKEANKPDKTPVGLMNGEQPVTLQMEYNIVVRRMSHDLFEPPELPITEKENDY